MITNPEAKRILCFGDSLTWGYVPGSNHERYAANVRWPGVLQQELGDGYEVIENGDSRPGKEGREGLEYIIPCLDSQDPLDIVIVMLGSNELKYEMQQTPAQVTASMKKLLQLIIQRPSQFREIKPKVLLMAPPIINEETAYCKKGDKYKDAHAKSEQLSSEYAGLAQELGIQFLSLSELAETGIDGVHLDHINHTMVGTKVAAIVRML